MIFCLSGSVRKKITALMLMPFALAMILVLAGTYIIYVENEILVIVRMEREWLDANLNGFKYFNKFIISRDSDIFRQTVRNLEKGYSINRIGPQMKAVAAGKPVNREELAKQPEKSMMWTKSPSRMRPVRKNWPKMQACSKQPDAISACHNHI